MLPASRQALHDAEYPCLFRSPRNGSVIFYHRPHDLVSCNLNILINPDNSYMDARCFTRISIDNFENMPLKNQIQDQEVVARAMQDTFSRNALSPIPSDRTTGKKSNSHLPVNGREKRA